MKVITEAILRDQLRNEKPQCYVIPKGKILSPAAREYLQQYKIKVVSEGEQAAPVKKEIVATEVLKMPEVVLKPEQRQPKFIDYETGAYYFEKPEHMTHLYGNQLVAKNHKRIVFRGKLDSLEALFVLNQTILMEMGGQEKLIADLDDIVHGLQEMMRCDVLEETYRQDRLIGLSHAELREHSHNPMKYYNIKQMVLPNYSLGRVYALLNQLRAAVRELEVAAVCAFKDGKHYRREDILEALNRLSSAMHIIMCKYLADGYKV